MKAARKYDFVRAFADTLERLESDFREQVDLERRRGEDMVQRERELAHRERELDRVHLAEMQAQIRDLQQQLINSRKGK